MTYTAVELAKHSHQSGKSLACDGHLRKHDVTKHEENKYTNTYMTKKSRHFLYVRPLKCATHIP